MEKEKKDKILKLYGTPTFKAGNTTISFTRQSQEDVNEIEKKETSELIDEWRGLCVMNYVIGQVSLSEMQRIDLIELELNDRLTTDEIKELTDWLDDQIEHKEETQEALYNRLEGDEE